jgi:hypothetical protein
MSKKRMPLLFGGLALAVCTLLLARQPVATPRPPQPAQGQAAVQQVPDVPDEVAYRHLFHHVVSFKKKAAEFRRAGKDGRSLETYFMRKAGLDERQNESLAEIASEYEVEVSFLDARAKVIIDAYDAQYPGGRVPQGQTPKRPPAELRAMSEERDRMVLRYRDRLRAAFGEEGFARFHAFAKGRVVPVASPPPANATAPAQPPAEQ